MTFTRIMWRSWLVIAGIRVAAFAVLFVLHETGRLTISALPLVLLLYPEGLILPQGHAWTVWSAVLFAIVLMLGSMVAAVLIAALTAAGRAVSGLNRVQKP